MAFVQQILFNIIYFIWINTYNRENRSSFLFFYSNYDISTILIFDIIGKSTNRPYTFRGVPTSFILYSAGLNFLSRYY